MTNKKITPAQGQTEARGISQAYFITKEPLEQAQIAQVARIHNLAAMINNRCPGQEVQILVSKDKAIVDILEEQYPFGGLQRMRRFGYSGEEIFPNGGLDEAQRWLEGIVENEQRSGRI